MRAVTTTGWVMVSIIALALAVKGGNKMKALQTSETQATIRPSDERGKTRTGWLDSRHTFSFGGYYDAEHTGYGALLVINDDRVDPAHGFGTHPHDNMEIISYVVKGALTHKDSMANGSTIRRGDVQRMTAGTGIEHSEFNPSNEEPVHFLQIWIVPEERGLEPAYEQKNFTDAERSGKLRLVGSHDGRDGSVKIHQDVDLYSSILAAGETAVLETGKERKIWVQVVTGQMLVNETELGEGDGYAISGIEKLEFVGVDSAEFLVFDLAKGGEG